MYLFLPNVQAQPPAPAGNSLTPSGETQEPQTILLAPGAGDGCAAAPCSAPSEDLVFAYLYNNDTKEIIGKIEFVESYLNGRIDVYSLIPNTLIKKFGGIKANQKIVVTKRSPEELRLEWTGQPQPAHR